MYLLSWKSRPAIYLSWKSGVAVLKISTVCHEIISRPLIIFFLWLLSTLCTIFVGTISYILLIYCALAGRFIFMLLLHFFLFWLYTYIQFLWVIQCINFIYLCRLLGPFHIMLYWCLSQVWWSLSMLFNGHDLP